jgi:mono/diheme cytochrome c family protein
MGNFFPRWTNWLPLKIAISLVFIAVGVALGVTYYATPRYTRVGYQPTQPVPFSHKIHAGQLGLDCRFCHSFGERSSFSNVPTNQTCANCHGQGKGQIKINSPKLQPVRDAVESGKPIEWVEIHKLPDYAYFNHSAHLNRGVSCVSCHGRVDQMDVVYQHEPQSMGWCLDCHRNPEKNVRPLSEVANLAWKPENQDRTKFYKSLVAGLTDSKKDKLSEAEAIKVIAETVPMSGKTAQDLPTTIDALVKYAETNIGPKVTQAEIGPQLKKHWQIAPPENCTACHR